MGATEIVLLVLGIIVFVLSFIIPAKKEKLSKESLQDAKEEIRKMVDEAVKEANSSIEDSVTEVSDYNVEKAERAMERLCNEKIMAINEYSSTVLESIDKNHQEVMFLYDMLNEKHNVLKETAVEVDKTVKVAKQTAQDVAVEMKEVKEAKPKRTRKPKAEPVVSETEEMASLEEDNLQMIPLDELVSELEDKASEAASEEVTSKTKKDDNTDTEDVVKQLEVIKSAKNRKTSTRKKSTKVKEGEAPDLNIGSVSAKKDGGRNSNERILQLHNEGKSNVAIAKELGLGIGEVKLVIDLFEGM